MQRHYNEHCLGLGRQALILHGSHRELEPFKPAEDPCYHSPSEVLALPLLSNTYCTNFQNQILLLRELSRQDWTIHGG